MVLRIRFWRSKFPESGCGRNSSLLSKELRTTRRLPQGTNMRTFRAGLSHIAASRQLVQIDKVKKKNTQVTRDLTGHQLARFDPCCILLHNWPLLETMLTVYKNSFGMLKREFLWIHKLSPRSTSKNQILTTRPFAYAYTYSKCTPIRADSKIPSGSLSIHMTPVCIMMEYIHCRIISNSIPILMMLPLTYKSDWAELWRFILFQFENCLRIS